MRLACAGTSASAAGSCLLLANAKEPQARGNPWAAKIATACRCSQELREFGYDPES